ncbi:class A beta-lactamase-related serine hydrolase [Mycobacterium sp. URHB0044]|uniref:class A beta-lactamase-related serine hydrolase n=1 Tax=Mycobacterium sp. URHB0044 TaxID=1380386 RepID=UPI001E2CA00C|nr:class A beta-lactamase-related serine hydrolase [Mycobacterium sp. URHB0044]
MSTFIKAALVSVAVGAATAGFVIGYKDVHKTSPEPVTAPLATKQTMSSTAAQPPSPPSRDEDLQASFEELAATLPADVGVAVAGEDQVSSFGTWQSGAAWSTIKVPLAIAALRKDAGAAEPYVTQAIAHSDNAAADQLWALLGAPTDAGSAVQAVLAEGGVPDVTVQTQQVLPPYSPYGQTQWSLPEAARFAFQLPCVSAASVLTQMKSIAADQQWGLAGENGVAAKGGWGPEPDGGYLVRQIAVVGDSENAFGVAIAAKPSDGSFATGTAMLDQLGDWVLDHREQMPKGTCEG